MYIERGLFKVLLQARVNVMPLLSLNNLMGLYGNGDKESLVVYAVYERFQEHEATIS